MDTRRLWRVALLAAAGFAAGLPARAHEPEASVKALPGASLKTPAASVRILVQSSPLAGFRYYAAAEFWDSLRVGDALELQREPGNPHDAQAIGVSWNGRKLGYVPRRDNGALAWALDRGERLQARISRLAAHPNPARRIEFEVFIE